MSPMYYQSREQFGALSRQRCLSVSLTSHSSHIRSFVSTSERHMVQCSRFYVSSCHYVHEWKDMSCQSFCPTFHLKDLLLCSLVRASVPIYYLPIKKLFRHYRINYSIYHYCVLYISARPESLHLFKKFNHRQLVRTFYGGTPHFSHFRPMKRMTWDKTSRHSSSYNDERIWYVLGPAFSQRKLQLVPTSLIFNLQRHTMHPTAPMRFVFTCHASHSNSYSMVTAGGSSLSAIYRPERMEKSNRVYHSVAHQSRVLPPVIPQYPSSNGLIDS